MVNNINQWRFQVLIREIYNSQYINPRSKKKKKKVARSKINNIVWKMSEPLLQQICLQ